MICFGPNPSKANNQIQFLLDPISFQNNHKNWMDSGGEWAEQVACQLYCHQNWTLFRRGFRMRGSEIDLALVDSISSSGRIVEVKKRNAKFSVELSSVEQLLSFRKLKALQRGADALSSLYASKHQTYLNWSLDVMLINPNFYKGKHLVTLWQNAVSLK